MSDNKVTISTVKRRAAQKIRHIPVDTLNDWLDEICKMPQSTGHRLERRKEICRKLTGGFWSQSISQVVWQMIAEKIRGVRK